MRHAALLRDRVAAACERVADAVGFQCHLEALLVGLAPRERGHVLRHPLHHQRLDSHHRLDDELVHLPGAGGGYGAARERATGAEGECGGKDALLSTINSST